jgi:hypothetical protein
MRPRNNMQITTGTMCIPKKQGSSTLRNIDLKIKKNLLKTYALNVAFYDI